MAFPMHTLVPWQRAMVEAVTQSTQTDPAMPAMMCLGFTAAALARRASAVSRTGLDTPVHLWVLVIAGSGENKSATFNHLCAPFEAIQVAFETNEVPAMTHVVASPRPAPTRYERLMADEKPDILAEQEVSLEAASWVDLARVVDLTVAAQTARYPDIAPDFLAFDSTPASLIEQMSRQALGVLQAVPEGGFASWIAGGRSTGHLSNLNIAWDEKNIRTGRVGRLTPPVQNASLSMVCSPQPAVFEALLRKPLMRSTGYLPRFLVCYPESMQGKTTRHFIPVPTRISAAYSRHIWALMTLPLVPDATTLSFDDEAERLIGDFYEEVEPRLFEGADLFSIADWVQKLRLNMVRIAGVQHLARYAAYIPQGEHRRPIDAATVANAIDIARWMIPHGQQAFGNRRQTRSIETEQREDDLVLEVLQARERFRSEEFSARDVLRAAQSRFDSAAVVQRGLDVLVARGVLSQREEGRRVLYRFAVTSDSDS